MKGDGWHWYGMTSVLESETIIPYWIQQTEECCSGHVVWVGTEEAVEENFISKQTLWDSIECSSTASRLALTTTATAHPSAWDLDPLTPEATGEAADKGMSLRSTAQPISMTTKRDTSLTFRCSFHQQCHFYVFIKHSHQQTIKRFSDQEELKCINVVAPTIVG